jgi:DNA-binding LacI/PurR family transcriptional regulator
MRAGFVRGVRGSGTVVGEGNRDTVIKRVFVIGGGSSVGTLSELLFPPDGVNLPLIGLGERESAMRIESMSAPGCAVIWLMPGEESLALMSHLERKGIPQLLVNRRFRNYDCVFTDPEPSIREGLSWLMIEGGRDLAFISREPGVDRPYQADRMLVFFRLALELGARLRPESVFIRRFDNPQRDAEEVAAGLFNSPNHPKAVFAMNEELAPPVMSGARKAGLRPGEDFFLLTFDFIPKLEGCPGVGMMRQRHGLFYSEARRWLTEGFAARGEPFRAPVKTELVFTSR